MTTVDVHTHLAPLLVPDPVLGVEVHSGRHAFGGESVGVAALYDPDALVAHLDATGLDVALVSVPPPYFRQDLDAAASARWAAAANDGLAARLDGHPRLRGLAYLPLHQPQSALREYHRIRGARGWVGVVGGAGGLGPSLADDAFTPLWRALDDDRQTMLLHPASTPDSRLDPFYLSNLLGNPVETGVAVAQLVFGDVLARYGYLKVVLVHGGGVVPAVAGRWDRGVATTRPGIRPLTEPPSQVLRRCWIDCLTHDPEALRLAVSVFGRDKVLVGSDWPFPMGTSRPRDVIAALDQDLADQAADRNAAAAFDVSTGLPH